MRTDAVFDDFSPLLDIVDRKINALAHNSKGLSRIKRARIG